jgi:hypothetical protein
VGQAAAVMVQVDQAVQGHQVADIPRVSPVVVIHQVSPVPDILRVFRRAAAQPVPLVQQWEDTQCPMVRFIQALLEAGLNRFPTFAILALATDMAIGRPAPRKWIGRATMGAGCLVSFGIDIANSMPAISFPRMGGADRATPDNDFCCCGSLPPTFSFPANYSLSLIRTKVRPLWS